MFHMAHLLFAVAFPFKAKNFMSEHSKKAHVIEVIVVLVLASLPGVIVLSTSNYQFDRFPPYLCWPSIHIFFYTFMFPFSIYATIDIAMLFTAFLFIRKVCKFNVLYTLACMYNYFMLRVS